VGLMAVSFKEVSRLIFSHGVDLLACHQMATVVGVCGEADVHAVMRTADHSHEERCHATCLEPSGWRRARMDVAETYQMDTPESTYRSAAWIDGAESAGRPNWLRKVAQIQWTS
jgi:hypothetical protein